MRELPQPSHPPSGASAGGRASQEAAAVATMAVIRGLVAMMGLMTCAIVATLTYTLA